MTFSWSSFGAVPGAATNSCIYFCRQAIYTLNGIGFALLFIWTSVCGITSAGQKDKLSSFPVLDTIVVLSVGTTSPYFHLYSTQCRVYENCLSNWHFNIVSAVFGVHWEHRGPIVPSNLWVFANRNSFRATASAFSCRFLINQSTQAVRRSRRHFQIYFNCCYTACRCRRRVTPARPEITHELQLRNDLSRLTHRMSFYVGGVLPFSGSHGKNALFENGQQF